MKIGWICPKCSRPNSPYVTTCPCDVAICLVCEREVTWYETMGYGSQYDGNTICVTCLDFAIDLLFERKNEV